MGEEVEKRKTGMKVEREREGVVRERKKRN